MQVQGANGSGKTSLLRTLCGFLMPDEGDIVWRGESIRELDEDYYAEMLYLGHLNAIKDELSALENLRISAGLSGVDLEEKEAIAALRRMGLRGREMLPTKVLIARPAAARGAGAFAGQRCEVVDTRRTFDRA